LIETEDMRRIVLDGADVLTVLKRGKKSRTDAPASKDMGPALDEEMTPDDVVPDDLKALEDEPEAAEAGTASDETAEFPNETSGWPMDQAPSESQKNGESNRGGGVA
jgi:hypothetical protein